MASEPEKRTKLSDYTPFREAAARRTPQARWDTLFAEGQNDIVLPLGESDGGNEISVEARISSLYTQVKQEHNARSGYEKPIPAVKLSEDKKQILNSETGKLLINTGRFLREHDWALFDDWNRAMSTGEKTVAEAPQSHASAPMNIPHSGPVECDHIDPARLRVLISRDPKKIAEMSTNQRWWSCMNEDHQNHQYVTQDIEQGTLVAYVVMEEDETARHPLMRQLLKPYRDAQGQTILVPAKIYGGDGAGNAETREKLKATTLEFVQQQVNHGAAGTYALVNGLYADGEATKLRIGKAVTEASLAEAMAGYIPGALKEFRTELRRDDLSEHNKDKLRKKVRQLTESTGLAEQYFRVLRRSALTLQLPPPRMMLAAAALSERSAAMAEEHALVYVTLGEIDRLCGVLEGKSELNWRGKDINAAAIKTLAQVLAANTTLTLLNVSGNYIGAEGAKALAANTTLASLDVSGNYIGIEGAKALAANTALTSLNVGSNRIGTEGAKALAANMTLTSLDVGFNDIGDEGAKALAANAALTSLNVGSNRIGTEGAKALAANTTLTSLDVRDVAIGVVKLQTFHVGLQNNLNLLECKGVGALAGHCRQNREHAEQWLTRLTDGGAMLSDEEKHDLSRRRNAVLHMAKEQGREEEISAALDRIFPPGRTVDVAHASRLAGPAPGVLQAF